MARLTISLPENLAHGAAEQAALQRRSASAYVALLIETDLVANGRLTTPAPELAEFIAKLTAAYAASPRVLARCHAALLKEFRAKKEAA